ncbi:unnamed protein product [Urochloa humidicola]
MFRAANVSDRKKKKKEDAARRRRRAALRAAAAHVSDRGKNEKEEAAARHPVAAAVQLCAPLQQHVSDRKKERKKKHAAAVQLYAPQQQHVNGLPVQMMVPAGHQAKPVPAAYQAFAVLDAAALIDVQDLSGSPRFVSLLGSVTDLHMSLFFREVVISAHVIVLPCGGLLFREVLLFCMVKGHGTTFFLPFFSYLPYLASPSMSDQRTGYEPSPFLYSMATQESPIFTPWIPSTPLFFTPQQIKRLSLLSLDEASGASIVVQPGESWPGSVHHPIARFLRRPSLNKSGDRLLHSQAIQTKGQPPSTSITASRFTLIDFSSGNSKSISRLESFRSGKMILWS